MGSWVVIGESLNGDHTEGEIVCDTGSTQAEAVGALRAVLHTYLPRPGIVERWRRVYRLPDGESYVVVIKGMTTRWHCTLRVAELVSDSNDPAVAKRVQAEDAAAQAAAAPQDRIPPGHG